MTFSMGEITADEVTYVRDYMQNLETHDDVIRCFQNITRATDKSEDQQQYFGPSNKDFTIYYRKKDIELLDRLLFKLKLKFPGFVAHTEQTLQEHF